MGEEIPVVECAYIIKGGFLYINRAPQLRSHIIQCGRTQGESADVSETEKRNGTQPIRQQRLWWHVRLRFQTGVVSCVAESQPSQPPTPSPSQFTIFLIRNDRCDDVLLPATDYSKIVSEAIKRQVIWVFFFSGGSRAPQKTKKRSSAAATFAFKWN